MAELEQMTSLDSYSLPYLVMLSLASYRQLSLERHVCVGLMHFRSNSLGSPSSSMGDSSLWKTDFHGQLLN